MKINGIHHRFVPGLPGVALGGALLVLLLFSGCASTQPQGSRDAAAAPSAPPVEAPAEEPVFVPDEAITELIVAREEARLGHFGDAEAAYLRAIEILEPLAERDASIAAMLAGIQEERDSVIEMAETELADAGEAGGPDEAEEILGEIEPEFVPDEEVEQAAEATEPDWPVVRNERVIAWIEAYSGKLHDFIAASMKRSGKYEARFREIFAEEGVPQDLIYLAHTESGFKTSAYSRAHARGIFQFISGTARRYGMRVDWWVDERADPEKSCRASARYLKDLYDEFGDWSLALAGYNAGEGRVRRSIRKAGTKDFWELARRRFFRRETRNYVPAIMAATIISKDPESFGFGDVVKDPPLEFETVTVPTPTDVEVIAKSAGVSPQAIKELNPALRRMQTPPGVKDYPVKVPMGHAEDFAAKLAQVPEDQRITKILHRVRRGDTLSGMARRYGTTVRAIQQANGMGRRTLLSIGQVLNVPRGPGAAYYDPSPAQLASDGTYRIRRGDTLSTIARRYRVRVSDLQRWNNLGRSTSIVAGRRLVVREPGSSAAVPASRPRRTVKPGENYTVARGDNPWLIARGHGVDMDDLLALNGLSRRSMLQPGQKLVIPARGQAPANGKPRPEAAQGAGTYVVRSGDNPWAISRRLGVSLDELLRVNGLDRRSKLQPGQRLVVPGSASAPDGGSAAYTVRRGDTLSRIAKRHGTTVERLCMLNNIAPDTVLHPGDTLQVQ